MYHKGRPRHLPPCHRNSPPVNHPIGKGSCAWGAGLSEQWVLGVSSLLVPIAGSNWSFLLQFVLKNYGENPENYNEELKKLELLRQVSMWLALPVL